MKLAGVPFWVENETNNEAAVVPTSSTATVAVATAAVQLGSNKNVKVNGNNNETAQGLIPPFNNTRAYGAIPIGVNSPLVANDDDSEDESGERRGFPSEAGWSTRMHRRRSSIKKESCCMQYIGIIFVLCYGVSTSLSGITVKLLQKDFHPYTICFWRFFTIINISLIIIAYMKIFTKTKLWPRPLIVEKHEHLKNMLLLLVRGILGCSGRMLYIYSITCMNLSDAIVIASASPVFMTFFAYVLLGESCGIIPVIVAMTTLVGVGIISRPPWLTGEGSYDSDILLGTGTGFAGMILTTLVMIVMRKLRHINVILVTISFASCGIVLALFLCLHNGVFVIPTDNWRHVWLLFASGATSFLGQTFLALGLKFESAGIVALLTNFSVVFSFIFEYIFLHNAPDVYSISGGIIVILCIVVATFRKWIGNLPVYNEVRHHFRFLLV